MTRPLLAVDGDSFAHRAYHGLPKSINRNAVVGFTNMIVRLWEQEQPRAVVVGWDTLEVPTYRHEAFAAYQSGREFDASLLEQLAMLPQLCTALASPSAKAPGYEADDFLAAAVAHEEKRGGTGARRERRPRRVPARERPDDGHPAGARRQRDRADRAGGGARALRRRADAGARLHRAARRPVGQAAGREGRRARRPPRRSCTSTTRSRRCSPTDASPRRPTSCASTAESRRWTPRRRCPTFPTRSPTGTAARSSCASWGLNQLGDRLAARAQ